MKQPLPLPWARFGISMAVSLACLQGSAAVWNYDFRDGDRVVFVGNTFIEREQSYGWIETALTLQHADKQITFKNLGWSCDNVFGESRAYFGSVAEGYRHLITHVQQLQPTVLVVQYGANAAFKGEAGLSGFLSGYLKLLSDLESVTGRIVVLAPTPLEEHPAPLPKPARQNKNLRLYSEAIQKLATDRGHAFVPLHDLLLELYRDCDSLLTDNTMHFTSLGYRKIAEALTSQSLAKSEALRLIIRAKNELFFHHYRPQNETYLRGFRKHEQGQNAREIPMFIPLVAAKEQAIAQLRQASTKQGEQ